MSGNSFKSVFMVASCAGAALGCYLVSLWVASERAALEDVETKIVLAERDIRLLQTEIGTRGRLAQLERWNVRVLALSAPSADQFLGGSFELARMVAPPQRRVDPEAPIVLASAPADMPRLAVEGASEDGGEAGPKAVSTKDLLHTASVRRVIPSDEDRTARRKDDATKPATASTAPSSAKSSAPSKSSGRPATPAAVGAVKTAAKKSVDKAGGAAAKPVTKPVRLAKADPLAPLPESKSSRTSKDSGRKP